MLQFVHKTKWRMETVLDHFVRAYEPLTFPDDNYYEAMDETIAPTASTTPTSITPTISPREEECDDLPNIQTIDKDTLLVFKMIARRRPAL